MSQANESDYFADQVRYRPGRHAADSGQPAGQADPRGTGSQGPAGAVRHAVRGARRACAPSRDDAGRAGGAREGATSVDDQGHRRPGGTWPAGPRTAPDGQAAGDADRHGRGPEPGRRGAPAAGSLAGQAAGGAERAGAFGATGGRTGAGRSSASPEQPGATGGRGPGTGHRAARGSAAAGQPAGRSVRSATAITGCSRPAR